MRGKLGGRLKGHTYLGLIILCLLLTGIPLFVVSLVSYAQVNTAVRGLLEQANRRTLEQAERSFEIIMDQVRVNCNQVPLDNAFLDFELYPRGEDYEAMVGAYDPAEMKGLYEYLRAKQLAFERLNVLKVANEYIHSVYFYDAKKQMLLSNTGSSYASEDFPDQDALALCQAGGRGLIFMDTRPILVAGAPEAVITLLLRSINSVQNYFIVNLDAGRLYRDLLLGFTEQPGTQWRVLSATGMILPYGADAGLHAELTALLAQSGAGAFSYTGEDGTRYLGNSLTYALAGWRFVGITRTDALYDSMAGIRTVIGFSLLLLALFLVLSLGLLSRVAYRPVRALVDFAAEEGGGTQGMGELPFLQAHMAKARNDRGRLERQLAQSLPAFREQFLRTLIRDHRLSAEEVEARARLCGAELVLEPGAVLVLAVERYGRDPSLDALRSQNLLIMEALRAAFRPGQPRLLLEIEEDSFLLLVPCAPEGLTALLADAEAWTTELTRALELDCALGVGALYADWRGLPQAYVDALEAVRRALSLGGSAVIHIKDLRLQDQDAPVWTKPDAGRLLQCIQAGDSAQARAELDRLWSTLSCARTPYRTMQNAAFQWAGQMLECAERMGMDTGTLLSEGGFDWVALAKGRGDTLRMLGALSDRLSEGIAQALEQKGNRYVEAAMDLLRTADLQTVTVNSLAEQLRINPSYLGRLFRQHTGQTLSAYLTARRIDQAKTLLRETTLRVKQIAEQLGYGTGDYFAKVFREQTGMTPGQYRAKRR